MFVTNLHLDLAAWSVVSFAIGYATCWIRTRRKR